MRKNWFLRKETFRIPLTDSSTMFAWKGNPSPHLCLPNSFQQKWKIFKQPFLFSLQIHHLWSKSGFRLTTGIVFDKVCTPPDPKTKSCPRLRSRLGLIPNDSNSLDWNWIYVLMKLSLLLLIDDSLWSVHVILDWSFILMHHRLSRLKYERIQSMSGCEILGHILFIIQMHISQ